MKKKLFILGIDGAPPELIFDKWKNELPNISKLIDNGIKARLNSTIPPSTISAWNSMISGKDSSELGIFSYTRKDAKGNSRLVNSNDINCDLIWDILGKQNKKSVALYVPLIYPVKPINGILVGGFLTPSVNSFCAYPPEIVDKIKNVKNPEIFFDVAVGLAGHKGMKIDDLINRTYEMTDMQIELLKDVMINKEWDFFMTVIIGTDRLQHMLWRHFDETHKKFIADSPYKNSLKDYYIYLDKKIGEIISLLDEDTFLILASDHGMIKQEGKVNINNWLIEKGYLVLKEGIDNSQNKRFNTDFVDMEKSVAWGGGAYNARVYINKQLIGGNYEKTINKISEEIKKIPDDKGNSMETFVYKKEEIYAQPEHPDCPDLTVYFDNLRWASNPDLGQKGIYSWETAVGADNAGHSRQGCFVLSGKGIQHKEIEEIDIRQVAPTILKLMELEIPKDIKIKPIEVN